MAILGVLLGVTMTVLAGCVWYYRREQEIACEVVAELANSMSAITDRVTALEKRKAVIAEAAAAQPKPIGVRRQWSENMPAAEAK